jgi:hypothetical protein
MRWYLLAIALPLPGCLALSTGSGTDTGSSSSSGGGSITNSSSSGGGGATKGTNCTTDPQSGITLCEQIANCPGVDVDPGAFPSCGFRLKGSSIYDLECGCGDSLCPIGAPTSCATAQQLLDQNASSLNVCEQVSGGTCVPIDGDGGAGSTSNSSCNTSCESQCAGDPNCIQLCGC